MLSQEKAFAHQR